MPLYLRISLFCILTHYLKQFYHYIHDIFSLFLLYGLLKRNSTLIPFKNLADHVVIEYFIETSHHKSILILHTA